MGQTERRTVSDPKALGLTQKRIKC